MRQMETTVGWVGKHDKKCGLACWGKTERWQARTVWEAKGEGWEVNLSHYRP
jgi:hypothetical protein